VGAKLYCVEDASKQSLSLNIANYKNSLKLHVNLPILFVNLLTAEHPELLMGLRKKKSYRYIL